MVFSLSLQTLPQFITIKTVKINRASDRAENSELGPSPALPAAGLSPAVTAVLEHLSAQAEPVTIGALSAMTGLHGNTVREHLEALIAAGFATKEQAPSKGRGRPAWLYFALDGDAAAAAPEYAGLAAALAAQIHRTSERPRQDGIAAGVSWGRQLASEFESGESGGLTQDNTAAQNQTVDLLDELGFAPVIAAGTAEAATTADSSSDEAENSADAVQVRLTRCPLLSAAHQYPDIVCGVHLGLVRGAMDTFGDQETESRLEPFAEPGACRLHLQSRKTHR